METDKSPAEDPCWESREWTTTLKADSVYRLGVCFRHLGNSRKAQQCFLQYQQLLLSGIDGTYSLEDVTHQLEKLPVTGKQGSTQDTLQKAIDSALKASGVERKKRRPSAPPVFRVRQLLPGRRTAVKK